MDKKRCGTLCGREYLAIKKKNKVLPVATTWTDLEGVMLSERSQIEKDKYCMISLICGI